jgi:hypothetical protein
VTRLLACLLALTCAAEGFAADPKEPPPEVVPAVVYRDHLFVHGQNPLIRGQQRAVTIRPIEDRDLTLVLTSTIGHRSGGAVSFFVRGRVIVSSGSGVRFSAWDDYHDQVHYVSPDQLCKGKWSYVHPTGELIQPEGGQPAVWARTVRNLQGALPKAGGSDIVHTAIAAEGERNLLAFDLIVSVPPKGDPAPGYHLSVTRIVPEERTAPVGFGSNDPKPEVKHVETVSTAFSETFQAYLIGNDYYFLTKSGLVYRSPPAEKGKPRTMAAIWDQNKPRVRYIISDGNKSGVHYLLTYRDEKVGEKTFGWEYFQFAPDPKPELLKKASSLEDKAHIDAVHELVRNFRSEKLLLAPKP